MPSFVRKQALVCVALILGALCSGNASRAEEPNPITAALDWVKRQQAEDGSWRFDEEKGFANPGENRSRVEATSLALIVFLELGHTAREGQYRDEVARGLAYLQAQAKIRDGAADLRGEHGDMISHAHATAALCLAYSSANEKRTVPTVQAAVQFMEGAADPEHGGWGTQPREPADLASTAWCLLALKTAHMAYLTVDPKVVKAAAEFVESTRTPEKPAFGFRRPGDDPLATAMGLSCRQLLGRKDEIQWQGLDRLIADKQGLTSCEYRYFSMSALRTSRTDAATKWRERLVDSLGKAQVREGPDRGSWFDAEDPAARSDGRLFQSVLNTLFLNMRFDKWRIQERPQDNDFPL